MDGVRPKKSKGARLGNQHNLEEAGQIGRVAQETDAVRFAGNVIPIIRSIEAGGTTGMVSIANALNERGIRTARGGRWHCSSVRNVLNRSAEQSI